MSLREEDSQSEEPLTHDELFDRYKGVYTKIGVNRDGSGMLAYDSEGYTVELEGNGEKHTAWIESDTYYPIYEVV